MPEPSAPPAYLHCDVDKMFFSVEALERPGLADDPRPVIVGHDPAEAPRGIVTTANQAARRLGINSGMSAAIARRLALAEGLTPVFLPPRHDLYRAHSARLMSLLRQETELMEQRSIDEATLDWSRHGYDAASAVRLRERVLAETGLSLSMGLASNPLVAKMASERAKDEPSHVWVVRPGDEAAFLAPQPVRSLVGVGPKSEARLRQLGIETVADLQRRELHELVTELGSSYGRYLFQACRGQDDSTLAAERTSKSISAEHTFATDTTDRRALWTQLRAQAAEVAERLRAERLAAREVAVKLRYADWQTISRQMRLARPSDDAEQIATAAAALMRRHWEPVRAVRLIGIRAGRLEAPRGVEQPTLL